MYLSRLYLNPHSRQVQREIADAYQLHRTILRAFDTFSPEEPERVLFRLEVDSKSGVPVILVQSQQLPNWSWLQAPEVNYLLAAVPLNPEVKVFQFEPDIDEVFAFRLRANPTIKKSAADKEKENGKRIGIMKEEEQISWIKRKLEAAGCDLLKVRISGQTKVSGWQKTSDKPRRLVYHAVQFDGYLKVNNPANLKTALLNGIGPAKGFGFGLLSLARAD